mmetsp:Transcript_44984/g.102188  ORF Transcript_44984/g.102188 Transcript_44984/m.102188 type:complete len:212 (+) Transcript_44984:565-1200(+)
MAWKVDRISVTSSSCIVWAWAVATACRSGVALAMDQARTRLRVFRSMVDSRVASQGWRSTMWASGLSSGSQLSMLCSRERSSRLTPALASSCNKCLGSPSSFLRGGSRRSRQALPWPALASSLQPLGKGCLPVTSTKRIMPADQMSHFNPYLRPSSKTSGAMCDIVPTRPSSHSPLTVPGPWTMATPKSMTLTVGFSTSPVSKQLEPLRSR